MLNGVFVALIGLASALLGGVIQSYGSRRSEAIKFERELRRDAYLSYLNGISEMSFVGADEKARLSALVKMANARGRIAISGSEEVIELMNAVFSNCGEIHTSSARADLGKLLAAMRADSFGSEDVSEPDALFMLVFGDTPRDGIER